MTKTTVGVCLAGALLLALGSIMLNFRQAHERAQLQGDLAAWQQEVAQTRRGAQQDRATRDRALVESLRPPPAISPPPVVVTIQTTRAAPPAPVAPANAAIVGYLGDPVPFPAALDPKYTGERITAAFTALCQARGIKIKNLAVDTTEFPPLLYGLLDGGRDFFRQIDTELSTVPGYVYSGSVGGSTKEGATYFSLNMIPNSAYPRDQAEAIRRRLGIRLQMLGVVWTDAAP